MDSETKNKNIESVVERKSNWFLFFYWTIFYLSIFTLLFSKAASNLDPDLGWHLRIGKEIFLEKQVPKIENITYPTLGGRWVDHEWLSNLLIYILNSAGKSLGYWLICFVFSVITTATYFITISTAEKYLLKKDDKNKFAFLSCIAVLLSFYPLLIFFGNRLQILSWFFFTLIFSLFLKVFFERNYLSLTIFPFVFFVWANLHGSFVMGLVFFFCFCLALFLQTSLYREKLFVIATFIFSFLATFATPYKTDLWKLIVGEYGANRGYLSQIAEWKPLFALPNILILPSLYIAFFIVMSLIFLSKKHLSQKQLVLIYFLASCFFLVLGIKSRRFIPIFSIFSAPLIAFYLKEALKKFKPTKKTLAILVMFFFLGSLSYCLAKTPFKKNVFNSQGPYSPYQAIRFIREDPSLKELKIFNEYGWGGYLSWVWQDKQFFIDGRMPQKPLGNGKTFFQEYQNFQNEPSKKLDEYEIDLALVKNYTPFTFKSKTKKMLYKYLFLKTEKDLEKKDLLFEYLKNNWEKTYEDDESLVFTRSSTLKR